jgi:hypothetical protein
LVYGREIGSLEFILKSNSNSLEVEITSGVKDSEFPRIRKWSLNGELKLSYNDNNHSYLFDSNKTNYDCSFLGFELNKMSEISKLGGINDIKQNLRDNGITLKTNYIGPFRQIPERIYNIVGTSRSNKIGNKGENAYQILISDFLYYDGELLKKINDWYKANFDGWGIDINIASKPDCKIELTRDYPKFNINIRDVGEGMSQALPLVVSAFLNSADDMLTIIEQPELHLHPAAHGNLAELFANASKNSTNRFLIETHSQNFILRLRRLVAEGEFNSNDIVIYSVEYDEESNQSNLKRIDVNDLGEVSYWPENVFSETLDETIAIRAAQIKRVKNGNRN